MAETFPVTVTTDPILQPGGHARWIRFTVPVRIRNTSDSPIVIPTVCSMSVWRDAADTVAAVWRQECNLDFYEEFFATEPIEPGAERFASYTVEAGISGPASPEWNSSTVGGTFRFGIDFEARSAKTPGLVVARAQALSSNTFEVVERP